MGPSVSKDQSLNMKYWIAVEDPKTSLFPDINIHRSRLLLNTVTHQYIQEYNLHFVSFEDYQSYQTEIDWRRENSQLTPQIQIFPVKFFRDTSTTELCSTVYSGSIYFQKIEMRLKQINDIPYSDSLYLLKTTLKGFSILYKMYGPFEIREDMIFINNAGVVKVWINSNLSYNIPHNRQSNEALMASSLITMIQENLDSQFRNQPLFSDFLKKKQIFNECTFEQAIQEFNSFYQIIGIEIPSQMKSVSSLFERKPTDTDQSFIDSHPKSKVSKNSGHLKYGEESAKKLGLIHENSDIFLSDQNKQSDLYRGNRLKGIDNKNIHPIVYYSKPSQDMKNFKKQQMSINTNINENYLHPNLALPQQEVFRTTRSKAVKEKPFTPNMKIKRQPILIASDYYPDKKGSSGIEYRNSMKMEFPKLSPYSQSFRPFQIPDQVSNTRMCSAEPRNLPIPQSPHNNNNSFSSRLHFTPQQKLNKTGGEYRHSNKVSKENIKFHYLPVSTENNSQRTSEAENNTNVKPSPVHTKIKTRDKKTNYLKDDRDRKYNKSQVDRKYYTSNESYELDAQIAADLQKILKEGGF